MSSNDDKRVNSKNIRFEEMNDCIAENIDYTSSLHFFSQMNFSNECGFVIPPKKIIEKHLICYNCGSPPDTDLIKLFLFSAYINNFSLLDNFLKHETKIVDFFSEEKKIHNHSNDIVDNKKFECNSDEPQKKVIRKSAYNSLMSTNLSNMLPENKRKKNKPKKGNMRQDKSKKGKKSLPEIYNKILDNEKESKSLYNKYKKTHQCAFCSVVFLNKVEYNQHLKNKHPENLVSIKKPFKCPFEGCIKTYKNKNGIEYHLIHSHFLSLVDVEKTLMNF